MNVSIVIRTYNEERYLRELLSMISYQELPNSTVEVIIVDSGSSDDTLKIAESFDCKIYSIKKEQFTFGKSLNIGCHHAKGEILTFISGHCIPTSKLWLSELIKPLTEGTADYVYGKQVGRDSTKYSEYRLFEKLYPNYSKIPQDGIFCNNANAAITKKIWSKFKFNEDLTGLEDMHLARLLSEQKYRLGYVNKAAVYHIHNENSRQIKVRYERESYALNFILPEIQFTIIDFLTFFTMSIYTDSSHAIKNRVFIKNIAEIISYRFNQYWGTYKGHHNHRELTNQLKQQYFYPKDLQQEEYHEVKKGSFTAYQSKQ